MKALLLIVFVAIMVYASAPYPMLDVVCPPPVYGNRSYAPHPCKCDVYFECENGEKYAKKCEPPLLFNPKTQICDWPQAIKCEIDPRCETDTTTQTPTTTVVHEQHI